MRFSTSIALFAAVVYGGSNVLAQENDITFVEARDIDTDLEIRELDLDLETQGRRGGIGRQVMVDLNARDFNLDLETCEIESDPSTHEPPRGGRRGQGRRGHKQQEGPVEEGEVDDLDARDIDLDLETRDPRGGHGGRKGRGGRGRKQQGNPVEERNADNELEARGRIKRGKSNIKRKKQVMKLAKGFRATRSRNMQKSNHEPGARMRRISKSDHRTERPHNQTG